MSTQIEIINKSDNPTPSYETGQAAGMDLRANLPEGETIILPGKHGLVPTGLHFALPQGFEAQVRPRSGLAFKHGVTVLNSPGTIDADYRGDVGVILINHGDHPFKVAHGDRIAQLVVSKFERVSWVEVQELSITRRGAGGFGSTGKL